MYWAAAGALGAFHAQGSSDVWLQGVGAEPVPHLHLLQAPSSEFTHMQCSVTL